MSEPISGLPVSIAALRENAQRNLDEALARSVLIEPRKLLALVETVEAAHHRSQSMNQCALCGGSPYHRLLTHAPDCKLTRFSDWPPDQQDTT